MISIPFAKSFKSCIILFADITLLQTINPFFEEAVVSA